MEVSWLEWRVGVLALGGAAFWDRSMSPLLMSALGRRHVCHQLRVNMWSQTVLEKDWLSKIGNDRSAEQAECGNSSLHGGGEHFDI